MRIHTKILSVLSLCTLALAGFSQTYVAKDIRSFGAKGDGKTNDQAAFVKAADYFNKRGGNGKLTISPGTYVVGKQTFTGGQPNMPAYLGQNVLHFRNIKNFTIQGFAGSKLVYANNLKFGAFDPKTGEAYLHGNNYFVNTAYIGNIGDCIFLQHTENVTIKNIELDGNNVNAILGGVYGDVGIQNVHFGILVENSKYIKIDSVNVHHFALDGMCLQNEGSQTSDSIVIINSRFEYNFRQGLSWVGGNHLLVVNSKFNHQGKAKYYTPPGSGVDIEPENGPVKNGTFRNCEFIDNSGQGVVADQGDSKDCSFTGCTFWGTTNFSIWITRPGFTFTDCNIYGAIAHGFNSPDDKQATKFVRCNFEDKPYNGNEAYGAYMIDSNGNKRVSFIDCTITISTKRLVWVTMDPSTKPEEKYQFQNCRFIVKNTTNADGDYFAVIRGATLKNCKFEFRDPKAKKKKYWIAGFGENTNADQGGNSIIYL